MNIYPEENNVYQLNCTAASWSTNSLNGIYNECTASFLSDVDYVIETEKSIILLEYKNANIPNCVSPLNMFSDVNKLINRLTRKYYDSLIYLIGIKKIKSFEYVCVIEAPNCDSVIRGFLRNQLALRLPFRLQATDGFSLSLITNVQVMSICEWNDNVEYGKFIFEANGQS